METKAVIFDLDGVLVDTAKYHYLAWKKLADRLNIPFCEADNEQLKGVSRKDSLEFLLKKSNIVYSQEEKERFLQEKNDLYLSMIQNMNNSEVLPGVERLITFLKEKNIKIAVGSASKNAEIILRNTNLLNQFDVIVDGNVVEKAKPNPEVFLQAAKKLNVNPENCIVFEDASAGVEAAKAAQMKCIGLGEKNILKAADIVLPNLEDFKLELI